MSGSKDDFLVLRDALFEVLDNLRTNGKDEFMLFDPKSIKDLLDDIVDDRMFSSSVFDKYMQAAANVSEPGVTWNRAVNIEDYLGYSVSIELKKIISEMFVDVESIMSMIEIHTYGFRHPVDVFTSALEEVIDNLKSTGKSLDILLDTDSVPDLFEDQVINKVCLEVYIYLIKSGIVNSVSDDSLFVQIVIDKMTAIMMPQYTRFEKARIVGARALQISFGAPILVDYDENILDPIDIALIEFDKGLVPISIKRSNQ